MNSLESQIDFAEDFKKEMLAEEDARMKATKDTSTILLRTFCRLMGGHDGELLRLPRPNPGRYKFMTPAYFKCKRCGAIYNF